MPPRDLDYLEVAHQRAVEKKTHVSFPQLKYPSLRDEGLRDSVQWLMGKSMDDGAEGLWRVHDALYDFTDFIEKHPGGEEWLELTKGTDITEAFESHHLSTSVWKILEKYHVRSASTPRNSPFTFNDDGFYRSLKRDAVEELKKIPKHVAGHTDMIADGLLTTLLVTSALSCWSKNYWVSMVSYIIAALALTFVTVCGHNYIHRKTNWRMYLFSLSMWSYRDFRVSHALSHHLYPNTLMDLEVSSFEPIVFWNPRREKPVYAYFAIFTEQLIFPFFFFISFFKRLAQNFLIEGFFKQHYRWHDGIGLLLPIWIWLASGESFLSAVYTWVWIICTSSFIFCTIAFNAAHHHPQIFKDGDQVENTTLDWGVHELESVMDRKEVNANLFVVMMFFGHHTLHHFFPTLDHAILPYLYPVFLENCKKFRANFKMSNQFDLFLGQIKQTLKTEPTLLDEKWKQ